MRTLHRLAAVLFAASLCACGGPALQNVPRPDPAIVAGLAAGVAGAATLADPDGAAKRQEQKKAQKDKRPVKSDVVVPADVFDRLDSQEKAVKDGTAPPEPTTTTGPTEGTVGGGASSEVKSPIPLKKK